MQELKEVKIEKIIFSKTNPRKEFNKNSIQELGDSIETTGLVNPVTLRKRGNLFEVVSGERRVRACKLIKKKTVLSIIKDLSDEQVLEIQYIENLQRQDVHPLDEATFIQGMLETGKFTIETIADKIGKSTAYVASRLQLTRLIKDAHKLYAEGKIELGHALLISKMQEDAQQKLLKYISQSYRVPTVSELRVEVAGLMPNLNEAQFNRKDKLLLPTAGSCFDCPKRTGNAEDLFSEFSGNNICTDRSCYKEKVNLHMAMLIDKADESGTSLIRVSGVNHNSKKNVLGQSDYAITKKAEGKNVQKAIYTDGPHKGKLVNIVIASDASTSSAQGKKPTEKQQLAELNEEIKTQRQSCMLERITQEILKQDLKQELLPEFIDLFLHDMGISTETPERMCAYRGWCEETEPRDYKERQKREKIYYEKIKELDYPGKIELVNQTFIRGEFDNPSFNDECLLITMAKRMNINLTEIKKKIEEELPLLKKLPVDASAGSAEKDKE